MLSSTAKKTLIVGGTLIVILAIIAAIILVYTVGDDKPYREPSILGVFDQYAVSTNGQECAPIAANILHKNGSVVDAAIAALLCEGVTSPHSMGLGGGFFMLIWDAKTQQAYYLDAREVAPKRAHKDMFHGNASASFSGGLSIAVPGELNGYWKAHQRFGKLNWSELIEPTIELCETGAIVNNYLSDYLKAKAHIIKSEPTLAEILINPETKEVWTVGDRIKRPTLAKTLKILATSEDPLKEFYRGKMTDAMVKEIQDRDGIIEKKDFESYDAKWKEPVRTEVGNLTMLTSPLPSSGVLLSFMMNVLEGLVVEKDEHIFWQRLVETFKYAYAKRTDLGDIPSAEIVKNITDHLTSKDFAKTIRDKVRNDKQTSNDYRYYGARTASPEDSGTTHVSILGPDGSAVSVTSTINQVFGSLIRSQSTGIIYNDEMDDFSAPNITNGFDLPPSPNNFVAPGRKPLSSMAPTIFLHPNNTVRLVIGAAGGSKIPTAIALASVLDIWKGKNIKQAIDQLRIHHQLFPMEISYERDFDEQILSYLRSYGHKMSPYSGIGSAITAVERNATHILANSDYRREGRVAGV